MVAKLKVKLRNGFSDRNKIKIENTTLQYENFDTRTRTALINGTNIVIDYYENTYSRYDRSKMQMLVKKIFSELYVVEVEWNRSYDIDKVLDFVKQTIREDTYDSVLTTLEFLAKTLKEVFYDEQVFNGYNGIFEKEYVGYRFIGEIITQITDKIEIEEIEKVNAIKVDSVKEHINKSLTYLSDRTTPDYENSIKESISAVEAMCSSIVGKSDSLGKTLGKLEQNGVVIHGALKDAFNSLFGWTSDGTGIRHAGKLGGPKATFDEAKFMLVSCCAFINYLKSSMKD